MEKGENCSFSNSYVITYKLLYVSHVMNLTCFSGKAILKLGLSEMLITIKLKELQWFALKCIWPQYVPQLRILQQENLGSFFSANTLGRIGLILSSISYYISTNWYRKCDILGTSVL